jgi:hypothetical protein
VVRPRAPRTTGDQGDNPEDWRRRWTRQSSTEDETEPSSNASATTWDATHSRTSSLNYPMYSSVCQRLRSSSGSSSSPTTFGEFAYFLSYEQIAREVGISKSGTQCWVAWLIERGLVKIDHHGDEREGEGHAYIALSPSRPIVRVTMDPWSR